MNNFRQFTKGFSKGMTRFGHNIAAIVNTILLAVVYMIGVGVTSIISKLVRKNFLQRKVDKVRKSYWSDLNLMKKPLDEYLRQF